MTILPHLRAHVRPFATFLCLLLLGGATVALAAPGPIPGRDVRHPVLEGPAAGEILPRASVRLGARLPGGVERPRLVVSEIPFDPSAWAEIPVDPALVIRDLAPEGLSLDGLPLETRVGSRLWWAVVVRDTRSGRLRVSEVRDVVLGDGFPLRDARGGQLKSVATGFLPALPARSELVIPLADGRVLGAGEGIAAASTDPGPRPQVVWFADRDPGSARERLAAEGVGILSALPDGAFLVRLDEAKRASLEAGGSGVRFLDWRPSYRLSGRLDTGTEQPVEILAQLFPGGDDATLDAELRALGGEAIDISDNGINRLVRLRLPGKQLPRLAGSDQVAWIEPAPRVETYNQDAQWVVQTGDPDSRRLWDAGLRGQGQIVMIGDTGVRTDHEMFRDPDVDITDFGDYPDHRKIVAYRRGSGDPAIRFGDELNSSYHGTHTSGTAAGNDRGSAPHDGIAKDARLWFTDMAPASFGELSIPSDLNDLFLPSYLGNEAGAVRISSHSWGSGAAGNYTLWAMHADQFMWEHPDYLILFANGNSFLPGSVGSPATAKNVVSVGGTGNGDMRNWIYPGTSRGPAVDFRRKPTLCAPGDYVTSSVGMSRYSYFTYSGTSMATPAVAGGLALVRQYLTEGWYPTGAPVAEHAISPSAALLKAMAVASTVDDVFSHSAPDMNVGYGRMDLDEALYLPGDANRLLLSDHREGIHGGRYVEYEVEVADPSQPLEVTLCWTDHPGHPALARQLMNDLDLVVTGGGETYLGNYILAGASRPGGFRDSINVEEAVRVPAPATGVWRIRVQGRDVPYGTQPFALVVTGGLDVDHGSLALDREEYRLEDRVQVELLLPGGNPSEAVLVASDTEPEGERLSLEGERGVYRGSIPLEPVLPRGGDGLVSVSRDDEIRVIREDDGGGRLVIRARVAGAPPVVRHVRATPLTVESASISWSTDFPARGTVRYGENGNLDLSVEDDRFTTEKEVILTGLRPGVVYTFEVEARGSDGSRTVERGAGEPRRFTVREPGDLALVAEGVPGDMLRTWTNTLDHLGYTYDILTGDAALRPRLGDRTNGLRSYRGVIWQVGPDTYPAFNTHQREALDSLLVGGARVLVTGHDIAYSLADLEAPGATPETERWLETVLHAQYEYDTWIWTRLTGLPDDPVSGEQAAGVPYYPLGFGASGDQVRAVAGDGTVALNWSDNHDNLGVGSGPCGLRWWSGEARGSSSAALWGGRESRLVAFFFEWTGIGDAFLPQLDPDRRDVLVATLEWLTERPGPRPRFEHPRGGETITGNELEIRFDPGAGAGTSIVRRSLSWSIDGGQTWRLLAEEPGDVHVWDLSAVPNAREARLRLVVTDDGDPAFTAVSTTDSFVLARAGGDSRGPSPVAGSLHMDPHPIRRGEPAVLTALLSDVETGAESVVAAEWSVGSSPAPPGAGMPMEGSWSGPETEVVATVTTDRLYAGTATFWVRGRDAAGNWGVAFPIEVPVNGEERLPGGPVEQAFLDAPVPNPLRSASLIRFGVEESGPVRLEVFDLAGRLVARLADGDHPAGAYELRWDGRGRGRTVSSGVYALRYESPAGVLTRRILVVR